VPGDHLTMLHPPNVDALAQVLAAEFDRHQSRGTR
jgi:thioesterase domain-containing protein